MKDTGVLKIVSQKRLWYERLLAAIFFSIAIYVIILFYINNGVYFTEIYYKNSFRVLSFLIILVSLGIKFSFIVNHHFNFDLMKFRIYYSVGPLGIGKWHNFEKLDRVSTFLNVRDECEVNIWDIRNKRYKITAFDEIEEAVVYGRELAQNLEIKFLERN